MDGQPERPSEVLARQVRHWREQRKLSAQALADRLAELGAPALNRRVISKIENGDRGVTLDEWLQLAHALAVPPPLLFLDLSSGISVKIADGAVLHPWLAWEWVVGENPPTVTSRAVTRVEEFGRAKHAIELYRLERTAAKGVNNAEAGVRGAEFAKDRDGLRVARVAFVKALTELARCLDDMVENDMQPPAMPGEWVETMWSTKLLKYPDRVGIYDEETDHGRR